MNKNAVHLWVGLVLFLLGGALLALGGAVVGTALGTVAGLTGLGLMGWAWAGRQAGGDR
ncbi:MAG: hypothetical protein ACYS0G_00760 [Planctomycetota bacterium]|jgi:hypothetical protein